MNTTKAFGIVALACACAASYNSFANSNADWFSGNASGATGAEWNSPSGVAVSGDVFNLENDADTALTLTPTVTAPTESDGIVTITATAAFTPVEELPAADEMSAAGAKAAFAVKTANDVLSCWGYNGTTWTEISGAVAGAKVSDEVYEPTTFTVIMNYRDGKVTFQVGNISTEASLEASALGSVAAYGKGTLTSIDAKYEKTVAVGKDGKAYGSLTEAANTTGTGSISIVGGDDEPAANGKPVFYCQALGLSTTEADAAPKFIPVEKDENKGGITLKLASTPLEGVTIRYSVNNGTAQDTPVLPLTTGTYTIKPVVVTTQAN